MNSLSAVRQTGMFPVQVIRRCFRSNVRFIHATAIRDILSDAYMCEETWKKRLQSPLLKDLKLDQYFIELDKKFGTKELVRGVEIDLFANKIEDASNLDELEHLLYRFRRTKRAVEMMESTTYAVVRTFLQLREYEGLMRILSDRDSYGVFPNLFTYNILMDAFLKEKMYSEAARVSILMMLQEHFENKISCVLGIYACQMFLNECALEALYPKEEPEEVEEQDGENKDDDEDEEEVRLVRVPFLRNPWFDDHFEITDPKHLIGKTFYLLGRQVDSVCGRSYQLLGLVMYEKWEKAQALLKSLSESKEGSLLSEVIVKVKSFIDQIPDDENSSRENWSKKFEDLFAKLKSQNKIEQGELAKFLEPELHDVLRLQADDVEHQQKLFPQWEAERKAAFERLNNAIDKERRLRAIEEKKEYLYWKEKLLFFFENEDKNLEELKQVEELVASMKSKAKMEDTYIPPEIVKKPPIRLSKYQKLIRVRSI